MKFLIIGGDQRNQKLLELLKRDGHEIISYAIDSSKSKPYEEVLNINNLENIDAIIGPIPFTKDGENLNAPFSKENINIGDLLQTIRNQTLITGPIPTAIKSEMDKNNINSIDIMECEELIIYNTIATAEGTIELAIANTEINLHESKILILGFGRVAKTLALKLKGLSSQITCAARKSRDYSWIETLGFKIEDINNLENNLNKYDIIINTVPQIILNEEKIKFIKEDALIIDLASKPGGIDQQAIKKSNIKYIWALGLPRKSCTTFICAIYKKSNL